MAKYFLGLLPGKLPVAIQSAVNNEDIFALPRKMRSDEVPGEFFIINPDHLPVYFRKNIIEMVEKSMGLSRQNMNIFRTQINVFRPDIIHKTKTLIPHSDLIEKSQDSIAININLTSNILVSTGLWTYRHTDEGQRYGSHSQIVDMMTKLRMADDNKKEIKNNGCRIHAKDLKLTHWEKYKQIDLGYTDASMYDGKIFHAPNLISQEKGLRISMAIFMAFAKIE